MSSMLQTKITTVETKPLSETVEHTIKSYFSAMDSKQDIANIYDMILAEVEKPLLDAVMRYTRGNQSKAATLLGLSRGTLRKKLKTHGFI